MLHAYSTPFTTATTASSCVLLVRQHTHTHGHAALPLLHPTPSPSDLHPFNPLLLLLLLFVVVASVEMHPHLCRDRYLAEHVNWYVREMRVNAYVQFLESYRSVTVSSMAKTFGVSVPFLDSELSRFISAGRINAKIDKVCQVLWFVCWCVSLIATICVPRPRSMM